MFVYTSLSETFGRVISETLWMGTPVVAYDDKMGVAYQVHNGKNGVLVPAGNAEEFGKAVIDLMDNESKRLKMSDTARETQRALVHPEVVFKAYEEAYYSIDHIRERPPTRVGDRSLSMKWKLFRGACVPVFWKLTHSHWVWCDFIGLYPENRHGF